MIDSTVLQESLAGFSPCAVIIDGNNLVYQAVAGNKNPNNKHPGVRGILEDLLSVYRAVGRDTVYMVCWDSGHDPDRVASFPKYKQKDPNPNSTFDPAFAKEESLIAQEVLNGFPVLTVFNRSLPVEGDDLIYTSVKVLSENEDFKRVLIVSGDSDLFQLLGPSVVQYSPIKQTLYTYGLAQAHLGYPPERVPLAKAIMGDTSDCIPGVQGAGEKTATEIASQFSNMRDFRSWVRSAKKVGAKLTRVANSADVEMFLSLTTLKEVPYQTTSSALNPESLQRVLESLDLRDMKTRLQSAFMGM